MKRTCAAFGCKSNYKITTNGARENTEYVTCFQFPYIPTENYTNIFKALIPVSTDSEKIKNKKELTKRWVESMPNDPLSLVINKSNGICKHHFKKSDLIIHPTKILLREGAIPEFSNKEKKNIPPPAKRLSLEILADRDLDLAIKKSLDSFKTENVIENLDDILKLLKSTEYDHLLVKQLPQYIYISNFDFELSIVKNYVKIYPDLTFGTSLTHNFKFKNVSLKSNFYYLMQHVTENLTESSFIKDQICSLLSMINTSGFDNLKLLIEDQTNNIDKLPVKRNYMPSSLLVYLKIFLYSPKIYTYLRENVLILPHERNIRKMFSDLPLNIDSEFSNKAYLSYKVRNLPKREKIMVLMIDEIHIKPLVDSHLNFGTHGFDSDSDRMAKTLVGFMVKSIFGSYKEVIRLIPRFRETNTNLFEHTSQVLKLLKDVGANVISIITDNNRVNETMFKKFGVSDGQTKAFVPQLQNTLFLMYDSVHIMKNLRNNLLNKKDSDSTTEFYLITDGKKVKHHFKFKHLRDLYIACEDNPINISSKLTRKSLSPNNFERQKVGLAMKILCEENVSGLKYLADLKNKPEYCESARLIDIFRKWFNVMNVKTVDKGNNLHDKTLCPISSIDCEGLQFLRGFKQWLMLQAPLRAKFLTKQTFNAILTTTNAILEISDYLIKENYYGILTGVFQTDPLEKRFGLYRSIQGSNFHVAPKAAYQNENKLRISSIIDLSKSLKELSENIENFKSENIQIIQQDNIDSETFFKFCDFVFDPNTSKRLEVSDQSLVYYIFGYIVKKYLKNKKAFCADCKSMIKSNEKIKELSGYLDKKDFNEYYCYPSYFLIQKTFMLDYIMHALCFGDLAGEFFKENKKRSLIFNLFEHQINLESLVCPSGCNLRQTFLKLFEYYINIFLKRVSDFKNDYKYKSNDKSSMRKVLIFNPDHELNDFDTES